MVKDIVIIGAGGQGKEVAFFVDRINKKTPKYNILGFLDDNVSLHNKKINENMVLGGIDWLADKSDSEISCILALGETEVKKKVEKIVNGYNIPFINIIDPSVVLDITTCSLGKGLIIAPGVIIQPNARIEDHVLVNYNSVIGHDSKIGKFSTISPNVGIAGNVIINEGVFVGIGASVIQNLTIGKWSIIGAGAAVTSDIPENVVAVGIPAKSIKARK